MKRTMIKTIDKYLIKEVVYPFIVGVFAITIILLGNYLFQLTDLIIVKNVPISLVLKLLFYKLPETVVRTFPIAILFATMSGMGRLSRENEITAFRMGGVSLYRLIVPILIIGLIVTGFTFIMNEEVVPWSNHNAQNIIRQTILKDAMPNLEEEVFFKGPQGRLFYIRNYNEDDGILKDVVIYDLNQRGDDTQFPEVITSNTGVVEENRWLLKEGIVHKYNDNGNIIIESQFEEMEITITDEMRDLYGKQKTTSEMSREELRKQIALFKRSGLNVDSLLVDYHLKIAEPFTAFIFVLIGVPLSLVNRESRTLNIIMTITIIFLYYVILSVSRSLGRNYILTPLVAAWLPNIIFFSLGLFILFWRESWEKIIHKIVPSGVMVFLIIVMVPLLSMSVQAEDSVVLNSDSLNYIAEENLVEITGNINGNYGKYYIRSDRIEINLKEGEEEILKNPKKIQLLPGDFSGCSYQNPHYFFDAQKVIIYPNNYLEAYNVVFRELNGKLPLFYWPYLYISLREEQSNIVPRIGYSQNRGWFLKTTYYYNTYFDLPGEAYLDYYTKTGFAGGFKQHFIDKENQKAYLYYYRQANKIDLANLFKWEAELSHSYQGGNWDQNFLYRYREYQDRNQIIADLKLSYNKDRRKINLKSDYDYLDYHQVDRTDTKNYSIDLSYNEEIIDNLNLSLKYLSDYQLEDDQDLERETERNIDLKYSWGQNWETGFNYEYEELDQPERNLKTRWSAKNYISKKYNDFFFELLVERHDPKFSEEEDQVDFYRLPELNINYKPQGNFDYYLQIGNYYGEAVSLKGLRTKGDIDYKDNWYLTENNNFTLGQKLSAYLYSPSQEYESIPYQIVSDTEFKLDTNLTKNLKLTNTYNYLKKIGDYDYQFDRVNDKKVLSNKLRYSINNRLNINLDTGYDFKDDKYLQLKLVSDIKLTDNWKLDLGTTYDLNNERFEQNLLVNSNYEGEKLDHKIGIEYNLNGGSLYKVDHKLKYEVPGSWGWTLQNNISYDSEKGDQLQEANIQLKKSLHCRELIFSYDYINNEYTFEYSINLFPSQGVKFIKNEENLIFDVGIEERLNE